MILIMDGISSLICHFFSEFIHLSLIFFSLYLHSGLPLCLEQVKASLKFYDDLTRAFRTQK